jgi:flagellar basal-body rod modification protein FlgD
MQTGMIGATTASTTTSTKTTPSNTIDKNGFLQLLVAQLKNQDPTSSASQDPSAMVQQMTSFSSLEQAQQTNTLLTGLQSQTAGLFQAQLGALVGKNVEVNGSGFNLKSGAASMNLNLSAAANVTVTVKDAKGNVVATLPKGNLSSGSNALTWNGQNSSGVPMPDGSYQVIVAATNSSGVAVPFTTSMSMKVDSVTFRSDGTYLGSGSKVFSLADVLEIDA